jgi:diguanylate cyclase
LLVADVDNFKSINDSFGHDQGDRALKAIAETIANILRPGDIVARIGGEEFGILLPGASVVQIRTLSEAVRRAVSDLRFEPDGKPTSLSVSIGVATFQHAVGFSDLFRVADQQLYLAKQNGRNRISVSPADTNEKPLAA